MKKALAILVMLTLLVGLFAGCTTKQEAPVGGETPAPAPAPVEKRVMRIGIGLNEDHPQYKGLVKFKEELSKRVDTIDVQLFANSALGDDRTMMEGLQLGTQEGTCPSTAPIGNFVEEFKVFDFPYLFPNEAAADKVLDGEIGQELLDSLSAKGIKGLVYWENGFRNLTNRQVEVRTPADMKGLKIRTMENPIHLAVFRAFGANPTPMAFGELFTALQQKTVDGQENPIATIHANKFYEVQGYTTLTKHLYSPFVFMISQKFWDESTPEEQKALMEAATIARDEERKLNREANSSLAKELVANGMKVVELTADEQKAFQDKATPIYAEFAKGKIAEYLDRVQKELAK
ncbi:MAG TPA: TRAP transporter substrate-binding protein [Patescibacteria group bacterium]|nr:TRAP transporter substrate-binding protein [Patescibacteria group bacterium]